MAEEDGIGDSSVAYTKRRVPDALSEALRDSASSVVALRASARAVLPGVPISHICDAITAATRVVEAPALISSGGEEALASVCLILRAGVGALRQAASSGLLYNCVQFTTRWERVVKCAEILAVHARELAEKCPTLQDSLLNIVEMPDFWPVAILGRQASGEAVIATISDGPVYTGREDSSEIPWWLAVAQLAAVLAETFIEYSGPVTDEEPAVDRAPRRMHADTLHTGAPGDERPVEDELDEIDSAVRVEEEEATPRPSGDLFPLRELGGVVSDLSQYLPEAKALSVLRAHQISSPMASGGASGDGSWIDDLMRLTLHFYTRERREKVRHAALARVRTALFAYPDVYDNAIVEDVLGHVLLHPGPEDESVVCADISLRVDALCSLTLTAQSCDVLFETLEKAALGLRAGEAEMLAAVDGLWRVIASRLRLGPGSTPLRAITALMSRFLSPTVTPATRKQAATMLQRLSATREGFVTVHPKYVYADNVDGGSARFRSARGHQFRAMEEAPIISPFLVAQRSAGSSAHGGVEFSNLGSSELEVRLKAFDVLDCGQLLSCLLTSLTSEVDLDAAEATLSAIHHVVLDVALHDCKDLDQVREALQSMLFPDDRRADDSALVCQNAGLGHKAFSVLQAVATCQSSWSRQVVPRLFESDMHMYGACVALANVAQSPSDAALYKTLLDALLQACNEVINERKRGSSFVHIAKSNSETSELREVKRLPDALDFAALETLHFMVLLEASLEFRTQVIEVVSRGVGLGNDGVVLAEGDGPRGRRQMDSIREGHVWQRWREQSLSVLLNALERFDVTRRREIAESLPQNNLICQIVAEYAFCAPADCVECFQETMPPEEGDKHFIVDGRPLPYIVSLRLEHGEVWVCQRRSTGSSLVRMAARSLLPPSILPREGASCENGHLQQKQESADVLAVTKPANLVADAIVHGRNAQTDADAGGYAHQATSQTATVSYDVVAEAMACDVSDVLGELSCMNLRQSHECLVKDLIAWRRRLSCPRSLIEEDEAFSILARIGTANPLTIVPARSVVLNKLIANSLEYQFDQCLGVVSSWHEVSVVFYDRGDRCQNDILLHAAGSERYRLFVEGLGDVITSRQAKMRRERESPVSKVAADDVYISNGSNHCILYKNTAQCVSFKVATAFGHVAAAAKDDVTAARESLVHDITATCLNCHVVIVWNQSGIRFDPSLLKSSVVLVRIVVTPTQKEELFRVKVINTPGVRLEYGPLTPGVEGHVVQWRTLCSLIRATAINADIAVLSVRNSQMRLVPNYACERRVAEIKDILQKARPGL